MKKVLSLLTFVLGVAVLFAVPASAARMGRGGGGSGSSELKLIGTATPDYSSFVANDGEGTFSLSIDYSFYVDTATNVGLNSVSLNFNTSIFASVDEFSVSSPSDWRVRELSGLTNRLEISSTGWSGTKLFEDSTLLISADVTLFDSMIGSTVEQSWFASAVGSRMCRGCFSIASASDNGKISWEAPSAPAPVPEPATMLLFGIGLTGLVGSRIRRKKK